MRTQALLLLASLVVQPATAADEATSFTIVGRVIDDAAEPGPVVDAEIIALSLPPERATHGAEVTARRASGADWERAVPADYEIGRGQSAEDGSFELSVEPVADEGLHLVVRAFGRRSIHRELWGHQPQPAALEPLELTLEPGARLEGRVVTAGSEEAVVAAEVAPSKHLADSEPGRAVLDLLYPDAVTDGRGDWFIDGLAAGAYGVNVSAVAHFRRSSAESAVAAGAVRRIDVALEPARAIAGLVSDAEGDPVVGAIVRFEYSRPPRDMSFLRRHRQAATRSDDEGRYRLDAVLPEQPGRLIVRHPEHAPVELEVEAGPAGEGEEIDVALVPGSVFAGVVVDGREQGIEGVTVFLIPQAGSDQRASRGRGESSVWRWLPPGARSGGSVPGTTDADGEFRLDNAPAGQHVIGVYAFGKARTTDQVAVLAEGEALTDQWIELELGPALTGVVLDPSDLPVARARVSLLCRGGAVPESAHLETDADGRFEMRGVGGRECELAVNARGLAPTRRELEEPTGHHIFVLEAYGVITGRITLADGGAATTADIELHPAEISPDLRRRIGPRSASVAVEDGRYSYDRVEAGKWDVELSSPGYLARRIEDIEVAGGATVDGIDAKLERGAVVTGSVVRASDGSALVGAQVAFEDDPYFRMMMRGLETAAAETDLEGRFRLDGLRSGTATLAVVHPDFPPHSQEVEIQRNLPTEVRIELRAGASVVGRVVAGDGSPVAGADVEVGVSRRPGGRTARTDPSGMYRIDGLAAGPVEVTLSVPVEVGTGERRVSAELRDGDVTEVDFSLAGTTLAGRVVREGPTSVRASVYVRRARPGQETWSARTDERGLFEVPGLEPGEYDVSVFDRSEGWDRNLSSRTRLAVPGVARFEHDFHLVAIAVRGTVVDADSGEPIVGASVSGWEVRDGGPPGHGTTRSGASGEFVLSLAKPGSYAIGARQDGYAAALPTPLEVTAAGLEAARLELSRGSQLTGVVVDAVGREVPRAFVMARPDGAPLTVGTYTTADAVGRFAIALPAEGVSRLVVGSPEHAPTIIDGLVPGDEALEVVLRAGGSLELEVTGHGPEAELGLTIEDQVSQIDLLRVAPFLRMGPGGSPLQRLRLKGRVLLEHLPAGTYSVEVTVGDRTAAGVAMIQEGATAHLTLEL